LASERKARVVEAAAVEDEIYNAALKGFETRMQLSRRVANLFRRANPQIGTTARH
jgi:hypothetical protein